MELPVMGQQPLPAAWRRDGDGFGACTAHLRMGRLDFTAPLRLLLQ